MVQQSTILAGFLVATLAGGTELQSLVSRLGAPKYADRQAATVELERLGLAAFPALRAARADQDPEIRQRAQSLLDAIERASVGKSTPLQFEARRYSLTEIAEMLSEAEGVPISTSESRGPAAKNGITFAEPTTLGAWELLDRLGLTFEAARDADYSGHGAPVRLTAGPLARSRTCDDGPFRLTVRTPFFSADGGFEARRSGENPRNTTRGADLIIPIDVAVEPRFGVRIAPGAPIRITEALDNRGRSLELTARDDSANVQNGDRTVGVLPLRVRIEPKGGAIEVLKRLRGTVTLEVEARRLEPTVMPIPPQGQPEQRPYACGGNWVQVGGLTQSLNGPSAPADIDLSIRGGEGELPGGLRGQRMNRGLWRGGFEVLNTDGDPFWESLEVVDSHGKPFRIANIKRYLPNNGEYKVQLSLVPRRDDDPPAEVRFHSTIRATREIPFDFRDIAIR